MRKDSIKFNPEMTAAIIDGRKTQTRRPLRPQPQFYEHSTDLPAPALEILKDACPYGLPGDRLYIREAPEIIIEIVDVRVERLLDISDDDAVAEGFEPGSQWPKERFIHTIVNIYGPEFVGDNPWMWVITFKRIN